MKDFVITMTVLWAIGIMSNLSILATRREHKPTTPTMRAWQIVVALVILAWLWSVYLQGGC